MRLFILCLVLLCTSSVLSRNLRVILNHNIFYNPQSGHFIEVHLQFLAASIHYTEVSEKMEGEVEVQLILSQQNSIANFDKYRLKSKPIGDTLFEDFYSIRRFMVKPGKYELEMSVVDIHKPEDTISYIQEIEVFDWTDDLAFSDITLIETVSKSSEKTEFTKNGMEIIPRLSTYFPVESEKMIFYAELYNTNLLGDSARFALRYFISDPKTKQPVGEFMGIKRLKAAPIIPLLYSFNIDNLPSGEYYLSFELLDDEGVVVRKKDIYIDRYNPIIENILSSDMNETILDPFFQKEITSDSLFYFLESLTPISSREEQDNIYNVIAKKDTLIAQKYFQSYWKKTAPLNPTEGWIQYKKLIRIVEKDYGTSLFPGFRTDRGRVFLKYGPPNAVVSKPNEPNEYPYEIWQYYKIDNLSNKRFVFYNPTMVGNDYVLLHSDMIGELFNNRWQQELTKRGSDGNSRTRTNDEGIMEGGRRW